MKAGLSRFGKDSISLRGTRCSFNRCRKGPGTRLLHDRSAQLFSYRNISANSLTRYVAQEALSFGIVDAILEKRPEDRDEQGS